MRFRIPKIRSVLALALVVSSVALFVVPLVAQVAPSPAEQATDQAAEATKPEIDPLLPEEGLLRPKTWKLLGERLLTNTVDYLPKFFSGVLVLVIFLVLARILSGLTARALRRTKADPALPRISARLIRVAVIVIGVIMAAAQAGIAVGSLLASVGVIGLAVGLAAQDSLSNIVAGLTILWDRPFRTGDRVTIAGEYGEIRDVGLRTTRIRTVDARDAILPNKDVIEHKIINHTRDQELRLDVPIGISYESDIGAARKALIEAVEGHELLADEPEPEVVVVGLGDSSVDLQLRVYLRDPRKERAATWQMLEIGKLALDAAGIVIPFPQRTLHWAPDNQPLELVDERRAAGEGG